MKKAIAFAVFILALTASIFAAPASVRVVKDPAELPQPFAHIALPGDVFVSDGRYAAVIAGSPRTLWSSGNYGHPDISGYIAAFLPSDASARPDTQLGYPAIRLNGKMLDVTTTSVRPEGNAAVVRASSQGPDGRRLDIQIRYTFAFETGRMDVAVEIRNSGKAGIDGLSASLGANAWQSYNFSPYNIASFPQLDFRVYERPDHVLAWHNLNPVETSESPLPGSLRPGQIHRLSYSVIAAKSLPDLLDRLYRAVRLQTVRTSLEVKEFEGPAEIIVREPATGAVFFRTFLAKPAPLVIPLPAGTYAVQANFFPAVIERTLVARAGKKAADNAWTIAAPAFGRLRISLTDKKDRPVPGKISFIGLSPTDSPYFLPENPIVTGRNW
ncbi:MAG: hypothetical protein H6P95_2569, partial [Candidatus Aminicenantes bacterium]|nr:hypothetical protein [Candidatus Aminicenantes bacterium]